MAPRPKDCPCFSGARYAACCKPLHDGAALPKNPEALMRSRFAGFALGLGGYLYDTLASGHPDRKTAREIEIIELSQVKDVQRFLGLEILFAEGDEVLFAARVFERGVDRSFAELSKFVLEGDAWKYVSGRLAPKSALPETITREALLAVAEDA